LLSTQTVERDLAHFPNTSQPAVDSASDFLEYLQDQPPGGFRDSSIEAQKQEILRLNVTEPAEDQMRLDEKITLLDRAQSQLSLFLNLTMVLLMSLFCPRHIA